ncbi:pyridoxamine 5'-phosphate oxidase family protein [Streptomyces virginiae]|uniref:pyridoxamine 5'-phosphate oxidase family protein n=1 Tax=Streptomyces virginiae TaxID=1961 RepID=UPI00224FBEE5|nr:pyridoxamine 5'-phosphate oxidase family protein [Streptomyces virginiae]MCX4721398.1 helix-turn-helix domain-containing protein [Streptomyces virginiae]MCX5275909.1 helix-turn-helix domain-containing protein [Streptomyces virginiae]
MPSTHPQQSGEMTGRTDLGRRLAARREALGPNRDALGRRCCADGTYIAYLEEHAASPAIGTLVRVADALGLTVDDVTATGWSVLAVGELAAVTDPEEIRHLDTTARSRPWAGGPRNHWMRLTPARITGRRVVHDS